MISLKLFVNAIHDAILHASESLMNRNQGLLDQYFEPKSPTDTTLVPKSVVLEFYKLGSDGVAKPDLIQVPLITLIPISVCRIEKATLTADFEMDVVNDELQLNFPSGSGQGSVLGSLFGKPKEKNNGRLEIVISPNDTPEGLKLVVDAYEATLKQQLS